MAEILVIGADTLRVSKASQIHGDADAHHAEERLDGAGDGI